MGSGLSRWKLALLIGEGSALIPMGFSNPQGTIASYLQDTIQTNVSAAMDISTYNAASPDTTTPNMATNNHSQANRGPELQQLEFPLYLRIIATIACVIIFSFGVCGNLLVPLVVIKTRYLRNSTNLFLINLSVADLLVLIVCMPTVLIELHSRPETWLLGEPMCKYFCCRVLNIIYGE